MLVQVLLGRWRGAKVAVKILKASVQADAALLASFKEEAKMLCRLSHPNIMEFYGACLTADKVHLPMAAACKDGCGGLSRTLPALLTLCLPRLTQMMVISQVRTYQLKLTKCHKYKSALPARALFLRAFIERLPCWALTSCYSDLTHDGHPALSEGHVKYCVT